MAWPDYLAGQELYVDGDLQSPRRNKWNFVGVSVAFNTSTNMWDITPGGGAGGGHTIQDEGVAVTVRTVLNFVGPNVTVTDTGGKTTVTVPLINLGTGVTGTLPVASGGTGLGVLGTAGQSVRVNAGATAYEFFTPAAGISAPGGDGFRFTYSTTTTDADPGAGTLRANHATLSSATALYVDLAEHGATDVTAWLDSLDDSTGAIKGRVRLASIADPTKWIVYNLTGWTTAVGYRKLTISYVAGPGALPTTAGDTFLSFDALGMGQAIVDADVSASAAIAGSKIAPDFAAQNIVTTGRISLGTNPSTTGYVALPNNESVRWRNAANSADVEVINLNGSNQIVIGSTADTWVSIDASANTVTLGAAGVARLVIPAVLTPLQYVRVNAGGTALEFFTPPAIGTGGAKGNSPVYNGSAWVEFGVKTRATDLTDANATLAIADGNRAILPAATLTAARQGQFSLVGATDKEVYTVERYDTTANTYAIKNSLGVTIYTFPVSQRRMASFQLTGGEWALVSHVQIN